MILTSVAIILRVLSNPLGNVFQKQLTNRYNHPLLINFLTFLLLSVFCIIPAIQVRWLELPFEFWKYCILAGIVGATGNGFLVKALQCGDLSVLGPINSYKSVVGIIVGIFLLGEIPNLWGIAGMSLIVYGSYYVLDTMDEHFSLALLKRKEIQYRIWAMVLTAIEAVFIKKIILYSSTTISFIVWCWFGAIFSFALIRFQGPSCQRIQANQNTGYFLLLLFGPLYRHHAIHHQLRIRSYGGRLCVSLVPTLYDRKYLLRIPYIQRGKYNEEIDWLRYHGSGIGHDHLIKIIH